MNTKCCCVFMFLICFIILPLWGISSFVHMVDVKKTEIASLEEPSHYEIRSAIYSPHVDPYMSIYYKNNDHDPGTDPINHACNVEKSIEDEINVNNQKMGEFIGMKIARETRFYPKCLAFHQKNIDEKIDYIIKSPFYHEQLNILNTLVSTSQLERVFSQLSFYGVKYPIELLYDLCGRLEIQRGSRELFNDVSTPYVMKLLSGHGLNSNLEMKTATELDNALDIDSDELVLVKTDSFRNVFNFNAFLSTINKKEVYADLKFLHHFKSIRDKYSIDQWKSLLRVAISYAAIDHFKISTKTPHEICVTHFGRLFPIHTCHWIRDNIQISTHYVRRIAERVKNSFLLFIEKNEFELSSIQKQEVYAKIQKTNFYVNQCWMMPSISNGKEHILYLEDQFFNNTNAEYSDVLSQMHHDEFFRLHRNEQTSLYTKHLGLLSLTFTAWSDPETDSIVLGPGMLDYHIKNLDPDSHLTEIYIGQMVAHELIHRANPIMEKLITPRLMALKQKLESKYGRKTYYENIADYLGAIQNFEDFRKRSREEQVAFFLTVLRMSCKTGTEDHSSGLTRAHIMLMALKSEYETAMRTKLSLD